MAGRVRALGHEQVNFAVRLILTLTHFVLHDATLLVHASGVDDAEEMAHAVRFHPQRDVERGRRHVLEIIGAVFVRRAVLVGRADPLERLDVVIVEMFAAVEHQVLEQMREAGPAGPLVLGAHVVPDVHGHDGRLVVLVHQQRQAVFQDEPLIGDRDRRRHSDAYPGTSRSSGTLGGRRECGSDPERQGEKR